LYFDAKIYNSIDPPYMLSPFSIRIIVLQYVKYKNGYFSPPFFVTHPKSVMIHFGKKETISLPEVLDLQNDNYEMIVIMDKV